MKPLGLVVYDGPSMIDRKPIIAIITGIGRSSHNTKTGRVLQLWILIKDLSPISAKMGDEDFTICGNCTHRRANQGTCYVNIAKAPSQVWKSYHRGRYEQATPSLLDTYLKGQTLRLGAYGDPAALPLPLLRRLQTIARKEGGNTLGYTHQTTLFPNKDFKSIVMASSDSLKEAKGFWKTGTRTFRVLHPTEALHKSEILCPASVEMGQRTTCENCNLCDGTKDNDSRKNIAIYVHGSTRKRFKSELMVV